MKPEEKVAQWIADRYPTVDKIWIYGSRARGDHRERSDIDLAISMKPGNSLTFGELLNDVEEKVPTLLEIDLIDYDEVIGDLKKNIDAEKVLIYERRQNQN